VTSPDLEWVEFTDFSPGIFNNTRFAGGVNVNSMNPAMAQEADTYRCRSLVTGGLGPLPRLNKSFRLTTIPDGGNGHTYRVPGLGTLGQVFAETNATTDPAHRVEIHVPVNWYDDGTERMRWIRERIYDTTKSTETLGTRNYVTATNAPGRYVPILKTRMWPTDTLQPGLPVMVFIWVSNSLPLTSDGQARMYRAHPDPATPTTNSTLIVGQESSGIAYTAAVAHQGRIVLGQYLLYQRGVETNLVTNSNLVWTEVNSNALASTVPTVFAVEYDQFVTDMGSMTANELLVILSYGGGYIVSGDLDDPTLIHLPNIASPDGANYVKGCNTAIGYVYSAGPSGLWVWNGGDDATHLSPQLEGNSFLPGAGGGEGQCDRWMDLVLAPSNWVLDTATRSWWRIEDPDIVDIHYWSTSKYRSQTYGSTGTFTDAEPEFLHMFEYRHPAYSYSWKSQPLWLSRDRTVVLRDFVCALSGQGSVKFTFTNERGDTQVLTFPVNHTNIRNYRATMNLKSDNWTMHIESTGFVESDDKPAPLMHRCYVGLDPRTKIGPG
jgi:hypothetical protein